MSGLFIFDVDGTLIDDARLLPWRKRALYSALAERYGCSLAGAEKMLSKTKVSMPEERKHTTAYVFEELGFAREEVFAIIDSVRPEGLVKLFPGVKEMLDRLSEKHFLVIYSNTPSKALHASLQYLGIEDYFKRIYSSDQYEFSKPSPSLLKRIIEENGFSPTETTVVGDSLKKDVLPAVEVGAWGVWFAPKEMPDDRKGYEVVPSFDDWIGS